MKVGIIYYQYPLYNKGSYIQEQVDEVAKQVEKVVLLATHYPKRSQFEKPENLEVIWLPRIEIPILSDILFNLCILSKALFSKSIRELDIINVVCARGGPAAFFLRAILRKPVVLTIEMINEDNGSFVEKAIYLFQRWTYRLNFDRIICWSTYYQKYLEKWGIDPKKVSIIPGGINLDRYSLSVSGEEIRKKFPADCCLIVFAKPLYTYNRKMAQLLLRAISLVKSDVRLLVGDGEERPLLEKTIEELNLQKQVTFMPVVPITEIPKYIAASDIIVLPYTYSATTSRSLLESLAMGKPIITTFAGEVSKVVVDQKNALLVQPEPAEIAKAIASLSKDKNLRQKLGREARILVEKDYSIQKTAEKTIDQFKLAITNYENSK